MVEDSKAGQEGASHLSESESMDWDEYLRMFARLGNTARVEQAIGSGAKVDAADGEGRGALHMAAARGDRRTIEALLAAGANPLLRDLDGMTPRDLSEESRFPSSARLLEEAEERWAAERKAQGRPGGEPADRETEYLRREVEELRAEVAALRREMREAREPSGGERSGMRIKRG